MTLPIDSNRFSADYVAQPSDMLEIIGGLNALHDQLDKDNYIQRVAVGPVTDGDLLSTDPAFERVSRATGDVGPIGVADNSAVDGQPVRVLVYGTKELTLEVGAAVPIIGWTLHALRPTDTAGWAYGVGPDVPDNALLIGQVASTGVKTGTVWRGLCDVRMGPGAIVEPARNTGAGLWRAPSTAGVRIQRIITTSQADIPPAERPGISFVLPAEIPVEMVNFVGGDIWFKTRQRSGTTYDNTIYDWPTLFTTNVDLDATTYSTQHRWRLTDHDVYLSLHSSNSVAGGGNVQREARWVSGRESPANISLLAVAFTTQMRVSLRRDIPNNAMHLQVERLRITAGRSATVRLEMGFNEFHVILRNAASDLEAEFENEYTG